jgi:hypothetical protein
MLCIVLLWVNWDTPYTFLNTQSEIKQMLNKHWAPKLQGWEVPVHCGWTSFSSLSGFSVYSATAISIFHLVGIGWACVGLPRAQGQRKLAYKQKMGTESKCSCTTVFPATSFSHENLLLYPWKAGVNVSSLKSGLICDSLVTNKMPRRWHCMASKARSEKVMLCWLSSLGHSQGRQPEWRQPWFWQGKPRAQDDHIVTSLHCDCGCLWEEDSKACSPGQDVFDSQNAVRWSSPWA